MCFLVALCCLLVRRPNLEVAAKKLLHQQVNILILVLCCAWKTVSTALSDGQDISEVPGFHSVFRESHKNYVKNWCLIALTAYLSDFDLFLTQ